MCPALEGRGAPRVVLVEQREGERVFVAALLQWVWVNPLVLQANLWPEGMLGSPVTPWCCDQDRVQIQPLELTLCPWFCACRC